MSEREEYLDKLLRDMESGNSGQATEDEILDDYDEKLEGIDEDDFLRQFEKSLGEGLDGDMGTEFSGDSRDSQDSRNDRNSRDSEDDWDMDFGLDDGSTSKDFMDSIDDIVNDVKNSTLEDGFGDGDLSVEESLKNFGEEDSEFDGIGQEFAINDSLEEMPEEPERTVEAAEAPEPEALSEAEKLAKEIEGLNLELGEAGRETGDREDSGPAEEDRVQEKGEQKAKKGFFAKLSSALFGEEEEAVKQAPALTAAEIENLSDEELSALMELESQNAAAAEEEEAEKKRKEQEEKQALKEQKAQEKAEKKAEKKALKEQKAREKAEKKALKLQNQPPVEKTKPLPRKPVVMIMLFGLSLVVLVNLLSGLVGYSTAMSNAKEYYEQGKYVEAYSCLNEKEIKAADTDFYNKVRLNGYLQQQLNSYEAYQSQNMYSEALAALIGGIGRYDRFIEEATAAGVEREYGKMLQELEEALINNYQMSAEEARTLYALEDKKEFTYAVYDVIDRLGLGEEP